MRRETGFEGQNQNALKELFWSFVHKATGVRYPESNRPAIISFSGAEIEKFCAAFEGNGNMAALLKGAFFEEDTQNRSQNIRARLETKDASPEDSSAALQAA